MTFNFADVIPRNRDDYASTDHLVRRVRMEGRFIAEKYIRELIESGQLTGNHPGQGGWVFEDTYNGVSMRLVCDMDEELEPRIITGVSKIVNEEQAIDHWGDTKVEQVKLRTLLSERGDKAPVDELLPLDVTAPIDVKGHSVYTREGWEYVNCHHCDVETRSKSELAGTPCE